MSALTAANQPVVPGSQVLLSRYAKQTDFAIGSPMYVLALKPCLHLLLHVYFTCLHITLPRTLNLD